MVEGVQLNWLAALLDVGDGGPRKSQLSREHLLRHFFLVSGLCEYSAKLAVKELVVGTRRSHVDSVTQDL